MAEVREVRVPDIGDFDAVDVIDVLVAPGDRVAEEDGLITLESEKASMDVPAPMAGTVREVKVSAGDQVSEGAVIVLLEVEEGPAEEGTAGEERAEERPAEAPAGTPAAEAPVEAPAALVAREEAPRPSAPVDETAFAEAYASPSVRRFARELGVDLSKVRGSGRKGRILREDVQEHVKRRLARPEPPAGAPGLSGMGIELPEIDFSRWGEVEAEELSKIQRLTGRNVHRSWMTIPHVTQHDHADITQMEKFRKAQAGEAEARGTKLTPIPFLIKAVVAALRDLPRFNASLSADGSSIVLKRYFHIGVAVDTPNGLVVPVVRDADRKGLFELAAEVADLAARARERKLKVEEMEGGCFTISSLGGIGGTAFTPIVNWPEVAILGVSRAEWRPRWTGEGFEPRLMLPLSLSYDHRVIDGAAGVRFTRQVARTLEDLRRLLL